MADQPCSKCGSELDTTGYPLWCKTCRAKYKREYEATKGEVMETRGFAAGVTAMRDLLAGEFERLGNASFSGDECALLIRQTPAPQPVAD